MQINRAQVHLTHALREFEASHDYPCAEIDWRWQEDVYAGFCVAPDGREYCLGVLGVDRADTN